MLHLRNAKDAATHALKELNKGSYAGANYLAADARHAYVVYGGDQVEVIELVAGVARPQRRKGG